jgi:hypothetical protein
MFQGLRLLTRFVDENRDWSDLELGRIGIGLAAKRLHNLLMYRGPAWTQATPARQVELMAFSEIAAHCTKRLADGTFENDWTWLASFNVRSGFERYGARALFSADGELQSMYWSHGDVTLGPDDPRWDHALWAWKCSVIVGVTLREHLFETHLVYANTLNMDATEELPPAHPIRRLLKPHTYGTVAINRPAINSLVLERALVHRATAFEYSEMYRGEAVAARAFWP